MKNTFHIFLKFIPGPNELQGTWKNALIDKTEPLPGNLQLGGFEYLILKN
jgi:hypothetical protein